MSNRGYALENQIENYLLNISGQLRDTAVSLRCHRIPSSGAIRGDKGDVISVKVPFFNRQLLFECKRRKERLKMGYGFTLPEAWLTKNEKEATDYECWPIFVGAYTGAQTHRIFVVIDDTVNNGFLKIPHNSVFSISINKKKRFKIRKWEMDSIFDKDIFACVELKGNEKNWTLISFEHFDTILKKKKDDYGRAQLGT